MHSRPVPVSSAEWFTMPVNSNPVFFGSSFQEIPCNPYLVTSSFSTFRKDLKFPLASGHLRIDTFHIDACFKAKVQMLLDDLTSKCILCTNGAVVRSLRPGISTCRKAERFVGLRIP